MTFSGTRGLGQRSRTPGLGLRAFTISASVHRTRIVDSMPIPKYAQGVPLNQLVQFLCRSCASMRYGRVSVTPADPPHPLGNKSVACLKCVKSNATRITGFARRRDRAPSRGLCSSCCGRLANWTGRAPSRAPLETRWNMGERRARLCGTQKQLLCSNGLMAVAYGHDT